MSNFPARHPARFHEKTAWDSVSCKLCPHLCSIAPSRSGVCGIRSNRGGDLFLDVHSKVTSCEVAGADEIPLYHFKPEMSWLRVSGKGCTMRCPFCNTYRYSQTGGVTTLPMKPHEIIDGADHRALGGVSFGVNEPAPMHEFVEEVFREARSRSVNTHLATSGMWSSDAFRQILEITDAVTFGLKGLDEHFLQTQLGADKSTLLHNIRAAIAMGIHVEITWLVIPELTDQQDQFEELLGVLGTLGATPPIILLPFEPEFMWTGQRRAASLDDLQRLHGMLEHYPGSVYVHHEASASQDTRCPKCRRVLIRRGMAGLIVTPLPMKKKGHGECPSCGNPVPYVT